jgi:hypothetical protein
MGRIVGENRHDLLNRAIEAMRQGLKATDIMARTKPPAAAMAVAPVIQPLTVIKNAIPS